MLAKFGTNSGGITWWSKFWTNSSETTYNWPNLEPMQVALYLAVEITQVIDSIPWVRCASGNVFSIFSGSQCSRTWDLKFKVPRCIAIWGPWGQNSRPKCSCLGGDRPLRPKGAIPHPITIQEKVWKNHFKALFSSVASGNPECTLQWSNHTMHMHITNDQCVSKSHFTLSLQRKKSQNHLVIGKFLDAHCISISSTYHGQLVGWYVSSVDRSVTLSDFHCVSGSLHSIYRPRDVRYFLKAKTNSFQTWFFQSVFSKLYLAYTSSKLCEFISFFWFYLLHSFSKTVKVSLSKNL